jgi:HEAT repeat protein
MKIHLLKAILVVGLMALGSAPVKAVQESDLIAILQSSAGAPAKCAACQQLRIHGTRESVPTLAGLLSKERVGHAARYALEGMPYAEAGAALRNALSKTSGPIKAGLVDSLGWRRDRAAVPLLTPLLSHQDSMLAAASASALGRIADPEAVTALNATRHNTNALVRQASQEALLHCAEVRLFAGDVSDAATLYRDLFQAKVPLTIRIAAWRGWALSDSDQRARLVLQALKGTDKSLKQAALKFLREVKDGRTLYTCLEQWDSLDAASQVAVLDAHLKFGIQVRPTIRRASESPHLKVRMAAWALGEFGVSSLIPGLTRAAAQGEATERDAARGTLARIHGPGVHEELLSYLQRAAAAEKAELLLALGERGDSTIASLLLQYAEAPEAPVRRAALASLRRLAPPETLLPLLDLAVATTSAGDRSAVLKALFSVCQAYQDKAQAGQQVIAALRRLPASERRHVLPLLGELATPAALAELKKAAQDSDAGLVRESIRVMTQWPNAEPVSCLLDVTRNHGDAAIQILALRGAITVTGREPDPIPRLASLKKAIELARRDEEKRLALSQLAQVARPQALDMALAYLEDPALANEAGLAALGIAESLAKADPKLGDDMARKVLTHAQTPAIVKRAWALRVKPAARGPFIRDWLVCGPYRQTGASGALPLFNVKFGPETPGQAVKWYAASPGDTVALAAFFPGQANCVAYLKAEITAPQATDAILLMGSDDGIKAWLNGNVVHSNNIDRGQVADQDMAPIKLKQGANKLLLKITQGGGGWSACTRIVGADGLPIKGLQVKSQTGVAPPVSEYKPPAVQEKLPQVATLPARAGLRTLCLSEDFYAEGAYYGDFNRDGHTDIVAGPFWFAGPDFQKRHAYRPSKVYDPKGYSDNFLSFTGDFNGDDWSDILVLPMPGTEAYWYANPAGKAGHWIRYLAHAKVGNESPVWGDVTGDGKPELLFCIDGYLGYAGPNPERPDQAWTFHAISDEDKRYQRFTHGVGYGDINGDGRVDVLEAAGWWEHTAAQSERPWRFHTQRFADAGAQMLVYDVDGDGLTDIITAWHCHHYGMVWWKQIEHADGRRNWEQQVILTATPDISTTAFRPSQLHALKLVDMNGDGLQDILTGKRFWAHGPAGDKEPNAAAVVFWFELQRDNQGKASFVPRLIDDNSGVGTQVAATDLNDDGSPDVIVANKKGIFVHLTQAN